MAWHVPHVPGQWQVALGCGWLLSSGAQRQQHVWAPRWPMMTPELSWHSTNGNVLSSSAGTSELKSLSTLGKSGVEPLDCRKWLSRKDCSSSNIHQHTSALLKSHQRQQLINWLIVFLHQPTNPPTHQPHHHHHHHRQQQQQHHHHHHRHHHHHHHVSIQQPSNSFNLCYLSSLTNAGTAPARNRVDCAASPSAQRMPSAAADA